MTKIWFLLLVTLNNVNNIKEKTVVPEEGADWYVSMHVKASGNFLQIPANRCDASAFYNTPFTQGGKNNSLPHQGEHIPTGVCTGNNTDQT